MKPRRILREKTQGFLRGWREWRVSLQSKWRPGAFYMRKHNDFSGGGGWMRRGCIVIRSRDQGSTCRTKKKQVSFNSTRPPTTYAHMSFCPQHDCWWCLFTTRRFHKSHLLIHTHAFPQIKSSLGSFFKLTVNFLLRRVTRVLWGVSQMTQHRLYLQGSLVNICFCSSFQTSRRFLWGAFSLGKRNHMRSAGVTCKFTVKIKATRILHEKT